ncbi:DNA-directed RNA polymerase subunit A' [Candidatus Micrarchaeota archaeon]|nr:DNA-directed RNA polymerase subunit A' [Candidatus Micrarchaeota archaeon]
MVVGETEMVIDSIKFSLLSPAMIRKMSAVKITVPDTYNEDGYPIEGGLVDLRLGVIDPGLKCRTCGGRMGECMGHFGHIELVRPVVHPSFAKTILYVLRSTCPKCKRVLVSEKELEKLRRDIEEEGKKGTETTMIKPKLKKMDTCPHCGAKLPNITLLKPYTFYYDKRVMLPSEIREWLEEIPNEDLRILGFDPVYARPEWMVLTVLPVPPVTMRPSITLETGERSEDDLTHKLVDIMRINHRLEANINAGAPELIIEDLWELLQYHVATYFDNELSNVPPARHRSGRALKTLSQRLKGKEGRFRYNLSGKRVNFSARTVVSPDPNISIDEVGVPYEVAEELTVPIAVTTWNKEQCKRYVLSDSYPRALYIITPEGRRIRVKENLKEELAERLTEGYTIERQLIDGDIVLFNRQPSLHRISMMCHRVRVLPGKTFRLNPAVCPPYNADFDGDEMNLHAIQTVEARVEADVLMTVHDQIISPRHGHAIIAPNEDHISAAYYTTLDETVFTRSEFADLLGRIGITKMPPPDRKEGYSGKFLASLLIPKEISFKERTKFYPAPQGEVEVVDGMLVKGALESKTYASVLVESIFHTLGSEAAKTFIDLSTRAFLDVLSYQGLTISLEEYHLPKEVREKCNKIIDEGIRKIDAVILQYQNKTLKRAPGMTLRETLEDNILRINAETRNKLGDVLAKALGEENPAVVFAKIGARGSMINVIQMTGAVGQQSVRGKRLTRGYYKRTLPHFKRGNIGAQARGFIRNNFIHGLNPIEYFFGCMGGRESLVNTAIRTGRSGYMQRRLIHGLQDLIVENDLTVRDAAGNIVQFIYGGDGKDPMYASAKVHIEMGPRKDDTETSSV